MPTAIEPKTAWPLGEDKRTRVAPLVSKVLTHEALYGDDPPTWPDAPTSSDAEAARERAVKRLRRFTTDFPTAEQLADVLGSCKKGRRCMSGACPECGRAFQRWLAAELGKLGRQT